MKGGGGFDKIGLALLFAFIIVLVLGLLYWFSIASGAPKDENNVSFVSIQEPIVSIRLTPKNAEHMLLPAVSEVFIVDSLGRFLSANEVTYIGDLIDADKMNLLFDDRLDVGHSNGFGLKINRPTTLSRVIVMFGPINKEMGKPIPSVIPMVLTVNTIDGKVSLVEFNLPTAGSSHMFDAYIGKYESKVSEVMDDKGNFNAKIARIYIQTSQICNSNPPHRITELPRIDLIKSAGPGGSVEKVHYSMTTNFDLDVDDEVNDGQEYNKSQGPSKCHGNYIIVLDEPTELEAINIEFHKDSSLETYNLPYKMFILNELGQLIFVARSLNSVNRQVEIRRHLGLKSS
jgi:hypothetical protein